MKDRVYMTPQIFEAVKTIIDAGHGVELEMGEGGNSHIVTYLIIGVKHAEESGYVQKLKVRHTSRYTGKFSDFSGVSDEFGDLCYSEVPDIIPFLNVISSQIEEWREASKTDPRWFDKMAKV
ncbi:MAG: hypothetical protein LBI31_00970 [Zoogloeaceae bacterium]|jgi:hypothetical protein|nr:hypothetical protein [Zoogloeaceae bacterium]